MQAGSGAARQAASSWVLVRAWFWMTSLTLVCVWSLMQPRSVHAAAAPAAPASATGEMPVYNVYVVPQFQPVEVHRIWEPALARIGQDMGVRFELKTAKDIPAFEAEF